MDSLTGGLCTHKLIPLSYGSSFGFLQAVQYSCSFFLTGFPHFTHLGSFTSTSFFLQESQIHLLEGLLQNGHFHGYSSSDSKLNNFLNIFNIFQATYLAHQIYLFHYTVLNSRILSARLVYLFCSFTFWIIL